MEAVSAGTEPKELDARAIQVMAELGIDIAGQASTHISAYQDQSFDYVITLCGDANEKCPLFFGGVKRMHMGFSDPPKASGSEAEVLAVYRQVRDAMRQQLGAFFKEELARIKA